MKIWLYLFVYIWIKAWLHEIVSSFMPLKIKILIIIILFKKDVATKTWAPTAADGSGHDGVNFRIFWI